MNTISLKEKKKALENAFYSVEMEGYVISSHQKELCLDVILGKITKEEYIKIILKGCEV